MGDWVASLVAYSPGDRRLQCVVGSQTTKASPPTQSRAAHGVPGVDRDLLRLPLASGRTRPGQWAGAPQGEHSGSPRTFCGPGSSEHR